MSLAPGFLVGSRVSYRSGFLFGGGQVGFLLKVVGLFVVSGRVTSWGWSGSLLMVVGSIVAWSGSLSGSAVGFLVGGGRVPC